MSFMLNENLKKIDFQCQWPCGEAPLYKQILSPAREAESFFICGQDSLTLLLQETAAGCTCGSQYVCDGGASKIWTVMFEVRVIL